MGEPAAKLPEQNSVGANRLRRQQVMPDTAYLLRVVRRQARFMLVTGLVILGVAVLVLSRHQNIYQSSISVAHDPRDTGEIALRHPGYPDFLHVARAFSDRFQDESFLTELAEKIGAFKGVDEINARKANVWSNLLAVFPVLRQIAPPTDQPALTRREVTQALREQFSLTVNETDYTLTLRALAQSRDEAVRLATIAMELFVKKELERETLRVSAMQELFQGYLSGSAVMSLKALQPKPQDKSPDQLSEEMRLKHEESELLDKAQMVKSEISDVFRQRGARRAALEGELNQLSTRLTPSHPLVIAKKEEIRQLGQSDETRALRQRLSSLRAELASNRAAQRELGLPVNDTPVELPPLRSEIDGQFTPALTDRVHELTLEKLSMMRQAQAPGLSTRLKVISPASSNTKSVTVSKGVMAASLSAAGALFMLLGATVREWRAPLARDSWRIARKLTKAQIANLNETAHRLKGDINALSVEGIDQLRREIDRNNDEAFMSWQALSFALRNYCSGNVTLLLPVGNEAQTATACHNFINVHATEISGQAIVLDFDHLEPLQGVLSEFPDENGLPHYLLKQASWQSVCLGKNAMRAYELVPPPAAFTTRVAKAYNSPILAKLLIVLSRRYQSVLLRGLKGRHLADNVTLLRGVTDCFLLIDPKHTTYAEIDATLAVLDEKKIRGFILLGE